MLYSTIGKEIYPGREIKIFCDRDAVTLGNECCSQRYRIIHVKEGFGIIKNGESSQLISAPAIVCLNEKETADFIEAAGLRLDILYFDPSSFNQRTTFEAIEQSKPNMAGDIWFLRAFAERKGNYIGANKTNYFLSNRISQLINSANEELTAQRDGFWPCRSRSFLIELVLLVSTIYDNEEAGDKMLLLNVTSEIKQIINYLHAHYHEKITIEQLTTVFHTNKTTLNKKFKQVTGFSVIEYLNNLRMQITCSMLRNTELSVNEIMDRIGYRDDSHFLRSFKKHAHCSPTAYRIQYAKA